MAAALDEMDADLGPEEFSDADIAFHVAIAGAAGNRLVNELTVAIRESVRGFLLGAMTVVGTFTRDNPGSDYSPYGVLAPLLVMAVPLYDTVSVILIRLREGRSPFQADRSHFSHRLVERGLTPPWAVRTIYLVTLSGGLGALLLHRLGGWGAAVVASQTLCVLGVVAILEIKRPRPGAAGSFVMRPPYRSRPRAEVASAVPGRWRR